MVDLERWAEENLTFPFQPAPDETAVTATNSNMDQGGSHQNQTETVSFDKACSKRHCEVLSLSNVYQPAQVSDDNLLWTAVQMEPGFKEDQPMSSAGICLNDLAWQLNENFRLNAVVEFGMLSNQGGISGTDVTGADLSQWLPKYKTLSPGLTTDALDPNTAMTSQQDAGWICPAAVADSTGVLSPTPASLQLTEIPKVAKKPRRPYRQDVSLPNFSLPVFRPTSHKNIDEKSSFFKENSHVVLIQFCSILLISIVLGWQVDFPIV